MYWMRTNSWKLCTFVPGMFSKNCMHCRVAKALDGLQKISRPFHEDAKLRDLTPGVLSDPGKGSKGPIAVVCLRIGDRAEVLKRVHGAPESSKKR